MYKKCYIIAGHGYGDPGAVYGHYTERQFIEGICGEIKRQTKDNSFFEVVNINPEMPYRAITTYINSKCKQEGYTADNSLLVSVHCDWYKASTGEMAYYYTGSQKSYNFAEKVLKEMPLRDKIIKGDTTSRFGRIGHVRDTIPLACLVECGSIGNDTEHLLNNQSLIASGLIRGVEMFAGIHDIDDPIDNDDMIELLSQNWHVAEAVKLKYPDDRVMIARMNKIQTNSHEVANYLRENCQT